MRIALGITLMVVLILAACRPESNAPPSIFDVNLTSVARDSSRLQTATVPTAVPTAIPTIVPTATPIIITRVPPSPTYPVDRSLYISETFAMGGWSSAYWSDLNNARRQLNEFKGKVVLVQTFSSVSEFAQEQTAEIRDAVVTLSGIGITEDQVQVVLLSIDPFDTLNDLKNYQELYGNPDWLMGLPNDELRRDISDTFGSSFLNQSGGGIFFIDKGGFGQLPTIKGFMPQARLRDIFIHLVGGPGVDEATEEPSLEEEIVEESAGEVDVEPDPEAPTESSTVEATSEPVEPIPSLTLEPLPTVNMSVTEEADSN